MVKLPFLPVTLGERKRYTVGRTQNIAKQKQVQGVASKSMSNQRKWIISSTFFFSKRFTLNFELRQIIQ